jgi:hypothetical protein
MSRTQQLEQQPEQAQAQAPATELDQETFGLPRPLYAQIMQLTPDDAEALASMLKTHQRLSGAILQVAARHMGNAAVQRAIAVATNARSKIGPGELSEKGATEVQPSTRMSKGEMRQFLEDPPARAQPGQGPLSHAEMHEFLEDPPAKAQPAQGPLSHAEMHEFLEDPPAKAQPAEPATPAKPAHATAEPAWVAGARAYNAAHAVLVDEFNELTSDVCRLDGEGKVDPQAVARWQSHHGLAADGKIGPHTVAAARTLKAKPSAVAAGPQADARPPV